MKTRTALLIALATAVAMGLGFLGVLVIGRLAQSLRASATTELARQAFVAQWQPPTDLQLSTLFPATVAGLAASSLSNRIVIPDWELDLPGASATYSAPNGEPIHVFVGQFTDLERDTLLQRAKAPQAANPTQGLRTLLELPGRLRVDSSDPRESYEIWTLGRWTFVFRSPGSMPAEFIRAYLTAIAGRSTL